MPTNVVAFRRRRHYANPWAGRLSCPLCGSDDWTMPYGAIAPDLWLCVACGPSFEPEET